MTAYADPVAQRRIVQLEAERDELRAKVARVRRLAQSDDLGLRAYAIDSAAIYRALDAPLSPSEPSSLPTAPGTPNDATGGAE
jgi:hypothetical protein